MAAEVMRQRLVGGRGKAQQIVERRAGMPGERRIGRRERQGYRLGSFSRRHGTSAQPIEQRYPEHVVMVGAESVAAADVAVALPLRAQAVAGAKVPLQAGAVRESAVAMVGDVARRGVERGEVGAELGGCREAL